MLLKGHVQCRGALQEGRTLQGDTHIPPQSSPLCWLGREATTGHPAARSNKAPDILKHRTRQRFAGDAVCTAARFTGKHDRVLRGQPSPACCPAPTESLDPH